MQKKIPQRQCMGCRERKAKKEMIRVVRGTDGTVSLDFSGKMNGRGAYICHSTECLTKAIKSRRLEKNFGSAVAEEVVASLKEALENGDK